MQRAHSVHPVAMLMRKVADELKVSGDSGISSAASHCARHRPLGGSVLAAGRRLYLPAASHASPRRTSRRTSHHHTTSHNHTTPHSELGGLTSSAAIRVTLGLVFGGQVRLPSP